MRSLLKRLLAHLPFKRQLYEVLRATGIIPERIYRHLHFTGIIRIDVGQGRSFRMHHHGHIIENELFWRGLKGWEQVSLEAWRRLCDSAEVVMDIGANTGVYALLAHTVAPGARILAVEAVERVHQRLRANIALNGGGIEAIHAAASDHDGVAVLYDDPAQDHVLSVSVAEAFRATHPGLVPVEVPCRTVAGLLHERGIHRLDVAKIDVELHEPEVLQGFGEVLRRDRPALLVEILNEQVAQRVADLVAGLGYRYYNIDEVSWPPARVEHLGRSAHYNFLLCTDAQAAAIGL